MIALNDNEVVDPSEQHELTPHEARLREYIEEAGRTLSALEGCISYTNADLMVTVKYLREDLDEVRAMEADVQQRLDLVLRITEQMYKLSRQISHFADTEIRLRRDRQGAKVTAVTSAPVRLDESASEREDAVK